MDRSTRTYKNPKFEPINPTTEPLAYKTFYAAFRVE